jgi:hypothetical protein
MLLFQIIYLWTPQVIGFACFVLVLVFMLKVWRKTRNTGFLILAILAALGEIRFLTLRFSGWLFPSVSGIDLAARSAWFSSLLGIAGVIAWWLINKQLAAKECDRDRDEGAHRT